MGSILTNGVFLPAEGERNCYEGLASNWTILDGVVGGYSSHAANTTIHVTAADKEAWNGKADTSALTAHTGDTTIHVTAADKTAWNGHVADSVKHVTAEDKAKWDAVTSKADDSKVVHKGGNETIRGQKTFENNRMVVGRSTDISSSVHLVNADVVGDNANGSSSFEVYGSSISSDNKIGSLTIGEYSNNGGAYAFIECNRTVNGVKSTNAVRLLIRSDGKKEFAPAIDNDCRSGIPSFRWADVNTVLINGINPGALFLPAGRGSRVDIAAYFTNTGNGDENTYTAPANGYIFLDVTSINKIILFSQTEAQQMNYAQTVYGGPDGRIYSFFPVRKNDLFKSRWYTASAASVTNAFFIPCQGNV